MSKDIKDDKDNILFKKLRKLINLIDQLHDCGVNEYIKLPRICSLGTQSSGKSSVLESIVGLDFLPRGDGVVTRRPLELRLCHITHGEPWAVFEERKETKFTDFIKVRETIEALTDEVCKTDKNIVDKPIVLNVYSQTCPDLTLVDLPGVTRVPVGNQPKNIEQITKDMATRYIQDPLTIILCVIAANSDIATSDGLKLAKEIDVSGTRTLGVLTKLDIMDEGTDARKALMNEEIPLQLGYIGVKNRSKQDLNNKISMAETSRKEKEFFKSHPIYKNLPQGHLGTDVLINKLTKLYFGIISENLPRIIKAINDRVKTAEDELESLGAPIPTDDAGKMSLLWKMIKEYCDIFRNVLQGKYNNKRLSFLEGEGGFKIRILYKKLLEEFTGEYKATKGYTDDNINYALTIHEGDSIPGFPSVDAFIYLLRPQLEKLKEPIEECFTNVFQYLDFLSGKILEKTFTRFPQAINDLTDLVTNYLIEEREKTKYLIDSIVDMEVNYLFTNDPEYLDNFATFIPRQERQDMNQNNNMGNNNQGNQGNQTNQPNNNQINNDMRPQTPVDGKTLFIKEIRNRIEAYFKLIVKKLRDSIPKIMGNYLVKEIEDNMQLKLYNKLYNAREIIDLLSEPESIAERRKELNDIIKVMKNAQKIIRRDPDLMTAMKININSEIKTRELKKEKEEELKKEKEEELKKEKEERNHKKKEILERQAILRKEQLTNKIYENKTKDEKIKEILEDMCVLGDIMKEEIIEEKKKEPKKFISIEEATKEENKESPNFCLGILAKSLEDMGITTAIERTSSNDELSENASTTALQFIMNGMIDKKKYTLHFDLGEERNKELLNNKEEQKKFNDKLRKKLSIEYNIQEDKIIIANPQKGSYKIQVIFQTDDFYDLDINQLKEKCKKDKEFKEIGQLKEVYQSLIMGAVKLGANDLDSRGNRESGWAVGKKRGGIKYIPPKGWKGYGLRVLDKYDNGNNEWLARNGNNNEWAVAYHGIRNKKVPTVEEAANKILAEGFKPGDGQTYANKENANPKCSDKMVGRGVYCSPNPKVMEKYAMETSTTVNNKKYKIGFMMRVKPDKIRYCKSKKEFWVLDGTIDQMRPYRILVKKC